jgi:hypothetical protein
VKVDKEKKLVGKWKNGKKAGKIMFHWKDGEGLSLLSKKLMLNVAHYLIKEDKTDALNQNNEKHRLKDKELEFIAKCFCLEMSVYYPSLHEEAYRAPKQQLKWVFTKQDMTKIKPQQFNCMTTRALNRQYLSDLLR